jgi:maleylacetoacetate isomerase
VNARLQLHGYWRSSAAYRVRIALHHKALHFEHVPVHLLRDGGEQRSAGYRALNPQGLVPTLVVDGEIALGQSLAICEYLEERWPQPALLPADPVARAQVRAMALLVACDVHPLNNLAVTQYLRAELGADDAAVTRWLHRWMARGFTALEALIERHSGDGRHAHGAAVTLADVCLVPQWYNARRFALPLEPYPRLAAAVAHLETLPAFEAARPEAQPDADVVPAG